MTRIRKKINEEMLIFVHRSFASRKYIHPRILSGFCRKRVLLVKPKMFLYFLGNS